MEHPPRDNAAAAASAALAVYPIPAHARRTAMLLSVGACLLFLVFVAGLGAIFSPTIEHRAGLHMLGVFWIGLGASVLVIAVIIPLVFLVRARRWATRLP